LTGTKPQFLEQSSFNIHRHSRTHHARAASNVSPALKELNNTPDCYRLGIVAVWFAECQASSTIDFKVARSVAPGTSSVPMIKAGAPLSLSAVEISAILRIAVYVDLDAIDIEAYLLRAQKIIA
jgi:hypothetical protein